MSKAPQISKHNLIRLQQYRNKRMFVRFQGGRELSGVLQSYDGGINLIFSEAIEKVSGYCEEERKLGVVVVRGALVMSLGPEEGYEQIQNPFQGDDEEEEENEGKGEEAV